jgi:hypothetical protein
MSTFIHSVSHEALSHPLEIEASFKRSERVIKFSAAIHLDRHFGNLGWDWCDEMDNMTVTVTEV